MGEAERRAVQEMRGAQVRWGVASEGAAAWWRSSLSATQARREAREATCLAAAAAAKATVTGGTPATPTTTAAVLKAQAVIYVAAEASPAQQTESVWEFSPPKETASEFSTGVPCFLLAIGGEGLTHASVRAGVRGAAEKLGYFTPPPPLD